MRRTIVVALALALALPAAAYGYAVTYTGPHARDYRAEYRQAVELHGERAPGRNIVRLGIVDVGEPRKATRSEVRDSLATLRHMTAPPPAPMPATPARALPAGPDTTSSGYSAPAPRPGGGYAIPSDIVQCESGGDYSAVNPSSGARGAYQIMPGTHASLCPDLGWSPADQDACAGRIWQVQGRGAWVC